MSETVYRIILSGECRTKEAYDQVLSGLQNISKGAENVNVNISGVGAQSELSLDRMARGFLRVGFMFNMYESALMRQEMAQYMVTNAQDQYNQAVERYGPASDQAIQAHRRLQQMIDYTDKANMRANISTALLTTQILLQTGILEKATLTKWANIASTEVATIAHGAETATLWLKAHALAAVRALEGPAGWAVLAGAGVAVAGVGVWMAAQTQQTQQTVQKSLQAPSVSSRAVTPTSHVVSNFNQINVNLDVKSAEDLHEAFVQAERRAQFELRRSPKG